MIINLETEKAFFLASNEENTNCLGIRVEMIDDVDRNILQEAVNLTMTRYSYLNVRFIEKIKPYYAENNEPYTVLNTRELPELGGPDTNYHLIAFTYYEKTITVFFFHGLVDGTGIFTIVRTLVHYYSKMKYDPNLSSDGVITIETPVNPNETIDAYQKIKALPTPEKIMRNPDTKKSGEVFFLSESKLISQTNNCHKLFHIKVSAEEMMSVCRSNEISPSLLVTIILADSIRKLHPEAKDIVGGLCINARKCLDNMESLRNFVVPIKLNFSEKVSKLPFDVKCTICRGKVFLNTDDDILFTGALEIAKLMSVIHNIPYMKFTRKLMRKAISKQMDDTFQVSYTGQSNFGAAEKYVNSVLIDYDMPAKCISVEMTAVGDKMFLCFGQKWEEPCYLNSFIEELQKNNIHAEIIEEKTTKVPKLYSIFNK